MKRIFTLILPLLFVGQLMAGGILTNTNQSIMYNRMQARDATIGIDAVYFNPAGLSFLPNNGFYLSLNSQTLGQTREISSDYTFLNDGEYEGTVSAPVFPGIYVAYKIDKLTFSAGFNPIGGGGGGIYEDGLPSFEYPISDLAPALNPGFADPNGALGYRMDVDFEGTATYFGYQANISYQINENLSIALGGRYVSAKETYKGYLRGIELDMGGNAWVPASDIMTGIASSATTGGDGLNPLIIGGLGGFTAAEALGAGHITQAQHDGIVGGLTQLGVDNAELLTIEQSQGAFYSAAAKYNGTASVLEDQSADMQKTASGFTPIISINYKLNDQFNFAFKYEHRTKLEFENDTEEDFITGFNPDGTPITMFPDGEKERLDIPTQIVLGATYRPIEKLLLSTGYHLYLDKNADWNGREEKLTSNSWEFAFGAEYTINDMFLVSAGWLRTSSGADGEYQTDLSFSMPSNTIGGGFAVNFSEKFQLNIGGQYTMYAEGSKTFDHDFASSGNMIPVTETYDKNVWIVGIGLNFNLGAGK